MADPAAFDRVLQLVADGRLTAEEAGPILDALDGAPRSSAGTVSGGARGGADGATDRSGGATAGRSAGAAGRADDTPARALRIEVTETGRPIINLRIPLSLGRAAINQVPGISEATSDRIREAIEGGIKGPIVEVDDDGDGVRISIE